MLPRTLPAPSIRAWWPSVPAAQAVPLQVHALLWGLLLLCNGLYWLAKPATSWPVLVADVALTAAAYAALFYLNWHVLVPRYLARNRLAGFAGLLLLALNATTLVRYVSGNVLGMQEVRKEHARKSRAYMLGHYYGSSARSTFISGLLLVLLSSYLRLSADYQQEQRRRQEEDRRRQELEKQHLAAELALLKAQLNPHFLFNTLNNIYSLTSEQSAEAPAAVAVLQLAELMRYVLYESAADTVPLAKEVSHLQNFLHLQRLRLPGAGPESLRFAVPENLPAPYQIAPMLLLPLVENAFKHGDLTARPHAVDIMLTLHDGRLVFTVRNQVSPAARPALPHSGGVGLANLRRRLLLLYPQRHELYINQEGASFYVALTLLAPAT